MAECVFERSDGAMEAAVCVRRALEHYNQLIGVFLGVFTKLKNGVGHWSTDGMLDTFHGINFSLREQFMSSLSQIRVHVYIVRAVELPAVHK